MIRYLSVWSTARWFPSLALVAIVLVSGCSGKKNEQKDPDNPDAEIKAVRDKLDPEDRKLVDAQDVCPIMTNNRLGVMGKPVKVLLKDGMGMEQTVFVCCKGCVKKAEKKPEETLATVAELKAKNKPAPQ